MDADQVPAEIVEEAARVIDPEAFEVPPRGYSPGAAAQSAEDARGKAAEILAAVWDTIAAAGDGYHTMDELYRYRMLYNAHAAKAWADKGVAVKSWRHSDGEECFGGGWFVVVATLHPHGQVSNHYEAEHWDLFDVPEVERAPEWDGHTPAEAADRLAAALRTPTDETDRG